MSGRGEEEGPHEKPGGNEIRSEMEGGGDDQWKSADGCYGERIIRGWAFDALDSPVHTVHLADQSRIILRYTLAIPDLNIPILHHRS